MSNNSPKALSLKQNMIWNSSGNFLYGISQWLLVVIVTRLGGYADAGVLSLAIAIVAVFYTIGLYGMRIFQATDVGFIYCDGDYVGSRVITSLLSILICAAFVFSSGYSKHKAYVILAFMLFRCVESCSDVLHGILQRHYRMDWIGISMTLRGFLSLAAFTAAFAVFRSLWLSCIAMALFATAILLFYDIPNVNRVGFPAPVFHLNTLRRLLVLCLPLAAAGIVYNTVLAIPRYYLEKLTNDQTLGIFSALYTPTLFITAMAAYLLSPLATEFGTLIEKKEWRKLNLIFIKSASIIIVLTLICTAGAYFVGGLALGILYGKNMNGYAFIFAMITMTSGIFALINLFGNFFTAQRRLWFLFFCHAGALIISFCITPPLIRAAGLDGAAWSGVIVASVYIIILLIRFLIMILNIKRKANISLSFDKNIDRT